MTLLKIKHGSFLYDIKPQKQYRIVKMDAQQKKSVISEIFRGKDYHRFLPKKDEHPDAHAFEIQRMRCYPGKHDSINPEKKLTKKR